MIFAESEKPSGHNLCSDGFLYAGNAVVFLGVSKMIDSEYLLIYNKEKGEMPMWNRL